MVHRVWYGSAILENSSTTYAHCTVHIPAASTAVGPSKDPLATATEVEDGLVARCYQQVSCSPGPEDALDPPPWTPRACAPYSVRTWCCYSPGWLSRTKPYIPRVALLMGSTLMAQFKALAYFTRNASEWTSSTARRYSLGPALRNSHVKKLRPTP